MTEKHLATKVMAVSLSVFLVVAAAIAIAIPSVSAIKLGPTPTPVPTPTPEIVYITLLVTAPPTPVPTPTTQTTPLPGSGLSGAQKLKIFVGGDRTGTIYVAKGDSGVISRDYPTPIKASTKREARFWLFGTVSNLDWILDKEVVVDSQDVYHIYLDPMETSGLTPGKYEAVVQFVGENGRLDITYDRANQRLDSIYAAVESVPVGGDIPTKFENKLVNMLSNQQWCDDKFETFNVVVEEPWISIDDSWWDNDPTDPTMHVSGATNLGITNGLVITLDPNNQITPREKQRATRVVNITNYEDPTYPRNVWKFHFSTAGLYPGTHELVLKSPRFSLETSTQFELVEEWPILTPTPLPRVYIKGFQEEPAEVPTLDQDAPAPTIVPEVYYTPVPTTPEGSYVVVQGEGKPAVVSTPEPTPVTPEETPTERMFLNARPDSPVGSSLNAMPFDPAIAILGLLAVLVLVRKR